MPTVTICRDQESFECGAQLLAVLCFPLDEERRKFAAKGFCGELIKWNMSAFHDEAADLRRRFPLYAEMFDWEIKRALRGTKTLLRNRAVAGRMGRAFLQEWHYRRPAILPRSMDRLSINQLSKLTQPQSGQSDIENVEKRAWRASRSVIGLAVAFDQIIDSGAANDNGYALEDLVTTERIIDLAIAHEAPVLEDSRFGVTSEQLVRVRWG